MLMVLQSFRTTITVKIESLLGKSRVTRVKQEVMILDIFLCEKLFISDFLHDMENGDIPRRHGIPEEDNQDRQDRQDR